MSPLWSDMALARAALEDAVARGIVDKRALQSEAAKKKLSPVRKVVRNGPTTRFAL